MALASPYDQLYHTQAAASTLAGSQASRRGKVDISLERLEREINGIGAVAEALAARLQSVLIPRPSNPVAGHGEKDSSCQLSARIDQLSEQLAQANEGLRNLHESIEL